MSAYEIVGVTFGLLSVVLTVRASVWAWPTGLVSVLAFGLLFHSIRLYADMALQGFYVVSGVLGWLMWLKGGEGGTALRIRAMSTRQRLLVLALLPPIVALLRWYLITFTDASLPGWDAAASASSVLAQVLLMRKVVETWVLWVAVDVLSIGIYLAKEVYLTAGLYAVFLVLAVMGWLAWRRELLRAEVQAR